MVTLKELQKFIKEIAETGIHKLELKTDDIELKVQLQPEIKVETIQQPVASVVPQPVSTPAPQQTPEKVTEQTEEKKEETSSDEGLVAIKAPMVGVFYRKPKPDKPPFVEVGDHVNKGDVVCLIEAMKIFNEIESEVSGTIVKVLVEDASPVEYDQPLFLVKPDK